VFLLILKFCNLLIIKFAKVTFLNSTH